MSARISAEQPVDAVHEYLERLRSMDPSENLSRAIDAVESEYDREHPTEGRKPRRPMGFRKP